MSDTITIIGNVATQPEHKLTSTGIAITSFRLASNDRRFDRQSNSWVDGEASFYKVSTFRVLAEHAFQSLRKGERIIVTGRLQIKQWESGSAKGTTAEIEADGLGHDLRFGTSRFERATSAMPASPDPQPAPVDSWAVAQPGSSGDDAPGALVGSEQTAGPTGEITEHAAGPTGGIAEEAGDDERALAMADAETPF